MSLMRGSTSVTGNYHDAHQYSTMSASKNINRGRSPYNGTLSQTNSNKVLGGNSGLTQLATKAVGSKSLRNIKDPQAQLELVDKKLKDDFERLEKQVRKQKAKEDAVNENLKYKEEVHAYKFSKLNEKSKAALEKV